MGWAILKHKGRRVWLPYYTLTTSNNSAYSIKIANYGVSSSGVYFCSPVVNGATHSGAIYDYGTQSWGIMENIGISQGKDPSQRVTYYIKTYAYFGRTLSVTSSSISAYSYIYTTGSGGATTDTKGPYYAYTGWKVTLIPDPSYLISVGNVSSTLSVASYSGRYDSADNFVFQTTKGNTQATIDSTGYYQGVSYGGVITGTTTKSLSGTTLTCSNTNRSYRFHRDPGETGKYDYSDTVAMYLIPNDIYYFAGSL